MVHWLVGRQAALLAAEDAHPLLLLGAAKPDLVAHGLGLAAERLRALDGAVPLLLVVL